MKRVTIILGKQGSGKSDIARELAKGKDTEIIDFNLWMSGEYDHKLFTKETVIVEECFWDEYNYLVLVSSICKDAFPFNDVCKHLIINFQCKETPFDVEYIDLNKLIDKEKSQKTRVILDEYNNPLSASNISKLKKNYDTRS